LCDRYRIAACTCSIGDVFIIVGLLGWGLAHL
jgi:hypothetical protein